MSRNDVTGDRMISRTNNDNFNANFDRIFGVKKQDETDKPKEEQAAGKGEENDPADGNS